MVLRRFAGVAAEPGSDCDHTRPRGVHSHDFPLSAVRAATSTLSGDGQQNPTLSSTVPATAATQCARLPATESSPVLNKQDTGPTPVPTL